MSVSNQDAEYQNIAQICHGGKVCEDISQCFCFCRNIGQVNAKISQKLFTKKQKYRRILTLRSDEFGNKITVINTSADHPNQYTGMQCFWFGRNIGQLTPKIIYLYYENMVIG